MELYSAGGALIGGAAFRYCAEEEPDCFFIKATATSQVAGVVKTVIVQLKDGTRLTYDPEAIFTGVEENDRGEFEFFVHFRIPFNPDAHMQPVREILQLT